MTERTNPSLWKGALAGLAAGLVASVAMNAFQAALAKASPDDDASEPTTEKAANRLSAATTGEPLPDDAKPAAGEAVHYALGAVLGLGYGIAAEYDPDATAGFGTTFGASVAAVLDEVAVPAAGLAPSPAETPPATHLYTLASHLVFGTVAEATRRLTRRALRD